MSKTYIKEITEEKVIAILNGSKKWGLKGGLAVLDQAVFSGANFAIAILLAKWLNGKDFGEYAIGLAVLTIFIQIYTSFTLEPMSVIGPSTHQDRLISYFMGQIWLLFLLSIPFILLLGVIALAVQFLQGISDTSLILFFSALGLPFILFPLLMRRVFYILLKPGLALAGSIFYFSGVLLVFYFLKRFDVLNGVTSILAISFAGLFSGLIMLLFLSNEGPLYQKIDLARTLAETWSFGKWLVISGALIGMATQSQVYLAGILSSAENAGVVRILQTFIQPIMLAFTAFGALSTPAIVNDFVFKDYKSMRRKIFLFTIFTSVIALTYEYLLVIFGGSLNDTLFGKKFLPYSNQIPIWGLVPVVWALFWGGGIALQAVRKPYAMVIVSGLWAFFSLISGLIFIPTLGVMGATISMVLGFVVAFISIWILYWIMVYRKYTL